GTLNYYETKVPYNKIYSFDGFAVFLRSNLWANKFANYDDQWPQGEDFVDEVLNSSNSLMGTEDGYLIIALDGETFGHHHPSLGDAFLGQLFKALRNACDSFQTAHLSDLYRRFPKESHFIPPSSWSTDQADMQNRDYFSWWKSTTNRIHQLHWRFTNLVLEKVRKINNKEINDEMDKALYSCQFWW